MKRLDGRLLVKIGEFLTTDHASRLDPYIKWLRKPLAILAMAMIAAILCGLVLHPRALILAAGLAAVMAVGTVWPWLSVRGLSGSLAFGRGRVREGEAVDARLVVRNRMPWGAWGLAVRGDVLDDASGAGSGMAFAAGWRTTESRWELVPERRGEYPGNVPKIASAFPFGLWQASQPLAVPIRLLVWPRTFPVGPIPEAASGREGDGLAPRNKAGTAGDLLGVRPYRRGDSLRRVHWPQSARHGHLIVCELEAQAMPRVQVVIDIHPDSHSGSGPTGSLEWAIRVAASFAEDWIGQGAEVEVVYGGRAVAASAGLVAARRARVLDALARLEPDGLLSLRDVLDGPCCLRFDGGLRLVVATDRAVRGLAGGGGRDRAERFVLLDSGAFANDADRAEPSALAVRPWIWIDDSSNVPGLVRRGWKEVPVGHCRG
jgi:uncharacterized protein (DUF58 family)